MPEQNPTGRRLNLNEIEFDIEDDKIAGGAYHRAEPLDPPKQPRATRVPKRNTGINARTPLNPFTPEDPPVENKDPQKRKRNTRIARLALDMGIPEEYVDKYYLKDDKFPGYFAEDPNGRVVAIEDEEGDILTPESTNPDENI